MVSIKYMIGVDIGIISIKLVLFFIDGFVIVSYGIEYFLYFFIFEIVE